MTFEEFKTRFMEKWGYSTAITEAELLKLFLAACVIADSQAEEYRKAAKRRK